MVQVYRFLALKKNVRLPRPMSNPMPYTGIPFSVFRENRVRLDQVYDDTKVGQRSFVSRKHFIQKQVQHTPLVARVLHVGYIVLTPNNICFLTFRAKFEPDNRKTPYFLQVSNMSRSVRVEHSGTYIVHAQNLYYGIRGYSIHIGLEHAQVDPAYRPTLIQCQMPTPFLVDRPSNFAHVFYTPLANR